MERAVQQLKMIGCRASGIISYEDLVTAVRSETRGMIRRVISAPAGKRVLPWLGSGPEPFQQLRREWGKRLIEFPEVHDQEPSS